MTTTTTAIDYMHALLVRDMNDNDESLVYQVRTKPEALARGEMAVDFITTEDGLVDNDDNDTDTVRVTVSAGPPLTGFTVEATDDYNTGQLFFNGEAIGTISLKREHYSERGGYHALDFVVHGRTVENEDGRYVFTAGIASGGAEDDTRGTPVVSYEHWCATHCYHCGRTFTDIVRKGATVGCICDPTADDAT